jgi:hypothetical protein
MIYYVDIDNTICYTENTDYERSTPIIVNIEKINKLYDEGNTVIYWTARGSSSGKNWENLTKDQLDAWGCKRNDIKFGKPSYDIFIDDKAIKSEVFFHD